MSCFLATNGAASTKSKSSRDLVYVCRRSKMRQNRGQQMNKTKRFWSLLVAALVLGYAGSYAAARKIMPPTTPADITPPAGNSAFLVGHAVGTQGYVCLPTSTGASWTVNGSRPEATLSTSSSGQEMERKHRAAKAEKTKKARKRDFEITHFLSPDTNPNEFAATPLPFGSPTWRSSLDGSVVWAKALTPPVASGSDASCPNPGAIPCLLLQSIGSKAGSSGGGIMTQTTFIQRLNTKGGSAPATDCSASSDVGKQTLVSYTADYYFFRKD
jgi:hypothetical protein